jgi:protein ImuA
MVSVRISPEGGRPAILRDLRVRLLDAQARPPAGRSPQNAITPFGLDAIDDTLPEHGLRPGAAHEFLTASREAPITLLARLAGAAGAAGAAPDRRWRLAVWIGPAVFPSVWALARHDAEGSIDAPLLDGHLLVDARRTNDRLWAADLSLRNPAVACVVADGSSFDSAATRRLQLAAESTGALCLLARHASDLAELSTATTRWLVEPAPTPHHSCARWTVRLLRCKGLRPTTHSNAWTVDIPHAPRDGRVSSILRDGPALPRAAPLEPERRVAPAHALRFG